MKLSILTAEQTRSAFQRAVLTEFVAGAASRQPWVQTEEMRPMDHVGVEGLIALREAVERGAIPAAACAGIVRHAEPPEFLKENLPESERVAWDEPVELNIAAIRVGEPGEKGGGVILLIQEKVSGAFTEGAMFGLGEKNGTLYPMRHLDSLIPSAVQAMKEMARSDWVARLTALRESEALDASTAPGGRAPVPRM